MPNDTPTIPRDTVLVRCLRATSVRGGQIVDPGTIVRVDADDVGAHLAHSDFELAPADATADVTAHLLPELPAPPAPVRLRWISGVSTRQFAGVAVHAGVEFSVDPSTAAGLIEERVAERVDESGEAQANA